jgi:hypothetical protein
MPVPALRNSFTKERERERERRFSMGSHRVCVYVCLIFSFVGRRALATFSERDLCVRAYTFGWAPAVPNLYFELIPFRVFSIHFFSLLSFSGLCHCCALHTSSTCFGRNGVPAVGASVANSKTYPTTTTTCTDSVVYMPCSGTGMPRQKRTRFLSVRSDPWGI